MTEPEALVRLQEIDLSLIRCRNTIAALPQRKKILAVRAARKKIATEVTHIVGQRKDLEMEIEDNGKERASFEAKVEEAQVEAAEGSSEFRHAKDLEERLSLYAKRLEKLSYEDDQLTDELEKIEHAERNAHDLDARLVEQEAALTEAFRSDAGSIQEEVDQLEAERAQVGADLTPELVARYDKACKRFSGIAVEHLEGNKPSACRVTLQPSQFSDLAHGPVITECPYCHRILVTEAR